MAGKEEARRSASATLKTLSYYTVAALDITAQITACKEYKHARVVSVYVSVGREVSTRRLIEQMFRDGKVVLIPFWEGDWMEMAEIGEAEYERLLDIPQQKLRSMYKHTIPMPNPKRSTPYKGPIDLAIVPGLAFSRDKLCRLGYGHGYYDRWLKREKAKHSIIIIGVCHECQLYEVATWPIDEHDVPMDKIITLRNQRC
jgi:5-formyltetrahydrofolate cyclo-ligase